MLPRLLFAFLAGLLVTALANQLLCDAPNPTLANPAYCGQRAWMTQLSAFLFGAGLMWVILLRRKGKASRATPPAPAETADHGYAGNQPDQE